MGGKNPNKLIQVNQRARAYTLLCMTPFTKIYYETQRKRIYLRREALVLIKFHEIHSRK